MADRDLVGQLFMVDFDGFAPSEGIERLVTVGGVGGVILFDKNVQDAEQVAALTNALQGVAAAAGCSPLLVGVDQEGGPVVRLRGTHFPSAMAFGAAGSEALVAAAAEVTARELRAVGIHLNFAPVLDVNSNPANPVIGVRSYGEDPALVGRLGVRAATAMQAGGVLAAGKHFPGHGDTALDSHLALPAVTHSRARLEAVELRPFREAIRAGVAAVMTAHIVYPAVDPERPATLSPAVIAVLRDDLGFAGLVVSDSMRMRAIADHLSPGEAAVRAVLAGVDLILACGPAEAQWEALEAVRAAAAAGRIPATRIAAAAQRVLAAKQRLRLPERALVGAADVRFRVGLPEDRLLADRVARAAATLVRDHRGLLPLPAGPVAVAAGAAPRSTIEQLAEAIRATGRTAPIAILDEPDISAWTGPLVVPLGDLPGDRYSPAAVAAIHHRALGPHPTVAVATGVPYPLGGFPAQAACLAVYGADPSSLRAAAAVLVGAGSAGGNLPVTVADHT
ncbi:MAG TPA: beta-N-acetylhexosaminidase [bacterium]|nr:beta-N-acetylhexosaminidase [bacterium]